MQPATRALPLIAAAALALPAQAQTPVTVALDWTPNTNHVGLYVARELGYYEDAGLDVEILPYSDTSAGTLIANGIADFGITSTLTVYNQRAAGSDILGVFAVVQKETGRLVFDAGRDDIQTPADLDGLTYGGFGTAWEGTLIETIVRNGGGEGDFEMVTLGTSAYEALANGAIDFTLEVYTWEGVQAEIEGRAQRAFAYADYGVPEEHTTLLAASEAWLEANPETAEAFLQATQQGYAYSAENPEDAAEILIAANAATLTNTDLVHASMDVLANENYLSTEDGTVGVMNPKMMDDMGRFMFEAGLLRNGDGNPLDAMPDFSTYYTNAYLD
ncbi:ABC transporter substrate-binding protein [Pelagibacterium xiamenense]|uniref:ABC transporter substrate-binding protein n=1 Tax=Pelagibacterium xiamenense TaxID=2901140 RepID=UPI001E5B89A4|nr:ABC transporter substrate-binding protein [Pelagibacterium xiamenense]MCD7060187.1 ABC transporter substrate-binding protein [Pelagibacterium xiamenense]